MLPISVIATVASGCRCRSSLRHREEAMLPSPRTLESCRREFLEPWFTFHQQLASEADAYVPTFPGRRRLLLLGDSILEMWRPSTYGLYSVDNAKAYANATEIRHIFRVGGWDDSPMIHAVSSDQTQHLLWRLQHGELSPAMTSDAELAVVVLIGTNNLRRDGAQRTAEAIMAVVAEVVHRMRAQWVLVLGLLPRSDGLRSLCPSCLSACCTNSSEKLGAAKKPRIAANGQLHGPGVMEDVRACNEWLRHSTRAMAREMGRSQHRRIGFADCAPALASTDPVEHGGFARHLRHDAVHPNPQGHLQLAWCVQRALTELVSR